jgi:tRNA(Ile2) C34 agmatinyltransferase TiaS
MSQPKRLSEWPACPDCETDLPVVGNRSHASDYRCLRCDLEFDAEEVGR